MTSKPGGVPRTLTEKVGRVTYWLLVLVDVGLVAWGLHVLYAKHPSQHSVWFCGSVLFGGTCVLAIRGMEINAWRENTGAINQGGETLTGDAGKEQRERLWRH